MKLLLDTHTFLWWDNEPSKLPKSVYDLCQDPNSELLLSLVSVWEIQIKAQLGKLQLRTALAKVIADQQQNDVTLLPITLPSCSSLTEVYRRTTETPSTVSSLLRHRWKAQVS